MLMQKNQVLLFFGVLCKTPFLFVHSLMVLSSIIKGDPSVLAHTVFSVVP